MLKREGTKLDPIDLEESEEEEERYVTCEMKEEARNRVIIEQAKLTGSKQEICLAVVKTMVPGTKDVKNRRIGKVIIKHFSDSLNIKIHCDNFKRRREPDYSLQTTEPNPREFVLFGVDFLSTKQIIDRFRLQGLEKVVWVDDSNCKLIFNHQSSAQKMLQNQLKYPDTHKSKIEEDTDALPRCWYLLKPYEVFTYQRNLYLRYATTLEAVMEKDIHNCYKKYLKVKQELYPKLLKTFGGQNKFLDIINGIQREKSLSKRLNERSQTRKGVRSQFQDDYSMKKSIYSGRTNSLRERQSSKVTYEHYPPTSRQQLNSIREINNSLLELDLDSDVSLVYFNGEDRNNQASSVKKDRNLSHRDHESKISTSRFKQKNERNNLEQNVEQDISIVYDHKRMIEIDISVDEPHQSIQDMKGISQSEHQQYSYKDLNELAQFFEVGDISPIDEQYPRQSLVPVEQKAIVKPKAPNQSSNSYGKATEKQGMMDIEFLSDQSY